MGFTLIIGPLCLVAYGVLRLLGRLDGDYGPGWDWQLAHLAGLVGMVFFVPAVLRLGRLLPRSPWRTGAVAVTLIGLAASMVQFGADMVEAFMAADRAHLKSLQHAFTAVPGVEPAFYTVGPQLFFAGLLVLTILLAVARRLPWWSPVVVAAGIALPPVTLNLISVAGLCMLAALYPARRATTGTDTAGR
jgi:hypothetical protein